MKQNKLRRQTGKTRKRTRPDPTQGLVAIPQVVGKTVEEMMVSNSYDDNGIDIFFDDRSGISFSFEIELKLTIAQTDGKNDKWREITRFSRVRPG